MIRRPLLVVLLAAALLTTAAVAQVGTNNGVLNPNLASADELATVPHVTAEGAAAIIGGRPYLSATAFDAKLQELALNDEQRAETRARLFVPINLNTASEEEMMLVPGVGDRMAHEFEEYRPYDGIERFRREIGKYVDSTEVARLERYVTIR